MAIVQNEIAGELRSIKECLLSTGYQDSLLRHDYIYTDFIAERPVNRSLLLAAFGQYPPSYVTSCFGVIATKNGDAREVSSCRPLGAPQIFTLRPGCVGRWTIQRNGSAKHLEDIPIKNLRRIFKERRNEWGPEAVLRAKYSLPAASARQLDFIDLGFLPALEHEAQAKLKELIEAIVRTAVSVFENQNPNKEIPEEQLFQLMFRMLAGKVLRDTNALPSIDFSQPREVIRAVEKYYGSETPELTGSRSLMDSNVINAVSEMVSRSFLFNNLSPDTLAYVYENTLVTKEARRRLSIHSTPSYVANYILNRLPFDEIPPGDRGVLDPTCGRGTFLVAAMRRLQSLLPIEMSLKERHAYCVSHIKGMEIYPYAREAAFFSLLYADFPNPNGWNIELTDSYSPNKLEEEVSRVNILVGNPPFEAFTPEEKQKLHRQGAEPMLPTKGGEMLRRALPALPTGGLVGVVMPKSMIDGRSYSGIRQELLEHFDLLEIVALPDGIFLKSDAETVLVMARKSKNVGLHSGKVLFRDVREKDRENFKIGYKATREKSILQKQLKSAISKGNAPIFWVPMLYCLWDILAQATPLHDLLEIHRGVEYEVGIVSAQRQRLIRNVPFTGAKPGIDNVRGQLNPYSLGTPTYIDTDPALRRGKAWDLSWDKPKIIASASRTSRGPWRILAAIDRNGLLCTQSFHAMWPKNSDIPLEFYAAVINGPLASAYLYDYEGGRSNRKLTINRIPFPPEWQSAISIVTRLVGEYTAGNSSRNDREALEMLLQIDAEVLRAYSLPPRYERELLDLFWQSRRPGSSQFNGYIPQEFTAWIPLYMYLSKDFQQATLENIIQRGPKITDPEIIHFFEDIG